MSPRFRFNHWLPKLLRVEAITLAPYIFFMGPEILYRTELRTIRHELTHLDQVNAYGWVRFYLSYLLYYFAERVRGRDHFDAYWNIPYEIEARGSELTT